MHGPEFCVLFHKLQSTCQSHKRATITERYPELCQSLEDNPKQICQPKAKRTEAQMEAIDKLNEAELFSLRDEDLGAPTIIDFGDNLTKIIYK